MNIIKQIEEQIENDYKLLRNLENELRTERDPLIKTRLQDDIKERREIIKQRNNELNSLKPEEEVNNYDINDLVKKIRGINSNNIQKQCGTLKVLDVSEAINIKDIFVEVNILEKPNSYVRGNPIDSGKLFDPDNEEFDRFALSKVLQERVPGLDVVKKYPKLMVLGKPGAGKSTFLQHIAILCNQGHFHDFLVPYFIRLKTFADETKGKNISLIDYLSQDIENSLISINAINVSSYSILSRLLLSGRVLLLCDGLDEVETEDTKKIVQEIRIFCEKYDKNHYILTCRTATGPYLIRGFTEVEVADFNQKQIEDFARKWFRNDDTEKAEQFIEKLNDPKNIQIKEIAITPILLILTCLVFQAEGEFPDNRAKLYEEGIEILLNKWDEARGISRQSIIYKNLSPQQKLELLKYIANTTFTDKRYFFEEDEISRYIADWYKDFLESEIASQNLEKDSKAILKAIELQHGLFVERAKGIYSFSHLTFQEYFVAKKNVTDILTDSNTQIVSQLCKHLRNTHWKEVFSLARDMLQTAHALQQLKQKIDAFVSSETEIQQLLTVIHEKSLSTKDVYCSRLYKPAAIRAFYLGLIVPHRYDFGLASYIDTQLSIDIQEALNLKNQDSSKYNPKLSLSLIFDLALRQAFLNEWKLLFIIPNIDDWKRKPIFENLLDRSFENLLDMLKKEMSKFDIQSSKLLRKSCEFKNQGKIKELITKRRELIRELITNRRELELMERRELELMERRELERRELELMERRELELMEQELMEQEARKLMEPELMELMEQELMPLKQKTIAKAIQDIKKWTDDYLPGYKNIYHTNTLNPNQQELLQYYYNINIFLVKCINSSSQLNSEARERLEDTLLLPIQRN